MLQLRKAPERGHTTTDWLDSYHTFSFGDYHDAGHMQFGDLRVINEDRVEPGGGFAPHAHRNMEIITYVLAGTLEHQDNLGNGSLIRPGELQRMSAGTGIVHSEFNPSPTEPVHLLQIWIYPEQRDLLPEYEQCRFDLETARGKLLLVASENGREGSLTVHQNLSLFVTRLGAGQHITHSLNPRRRAWIQVTRGEMTVNGSALEAGDGAGVEEQYNVDLTGVSGDAEALIFDLRAAG